MQVSPFHTLVRYDIIFTRVKYAPLFRVNSEFAQEMRYIHCRPFYRLFERNLLQNNKIFAVAQKDWVLLYLNVQDKVSRDVVPTDRLLTKAARNHSLTVLDTDRNVERDGHRLCLVPLETAVAAAARRATRAVTGRTGLCHDEHLDDALTATHLAVLPAVRTGLLDGHSELLGAAVIGLEQSQVDRVVRVGPLDLWHLEPSSWEPTGEPTLGRTIGRAEPVKVLALLGVGQNLIGCLNLLELVSIAGRLVGVVNNDQLFIRFFNFFLRGILVQTKDLIRVLH